MEMVSTRVAPILRPIVELVRCRMNMDSLHATSVRNPLTNKAHLLGTNMNIQVSS